jgi:AraC-like DNA-binding protein
VPETAYVERAPSQSLRPFVVCTWYRDTSPDGLHPTDRILPDGCVDIVWNGRTVFVVGPDTRPVLADPSAEPTSYAGVRFRPGAAPALLGLPTCELRDQRVPLEAVWSSAETRRLSDRLSLSASARDATAELERALAARRCVGVDPLVGAAVIAVATSPSLRVAGLAAQLGVTDRTLHRRVLSSVGYAPKVLQRVARFRRFLAASQREGDVGLARLALIAGYADQAHLTRECTALAGLTPLQLVRGSDVRLVQDGLTHRDGGCDVTGAYEGVLS